MASETRGMLPAFLPDGALLFFPMVEHSGSAGGRLPAGQPQSQAENRHMLTRMHYFFHR
jgi:hypothetical protein